MVYLVSCLSLLVLVVSAIVIYHSFVLNFNGKLVGGSRVWWSSFECGFVSQGASENYFSSSFALMMVFFVLFDLEVALLVALPLQGLLYKSFGGYFFFIVCLSLGYWYEVEKGYVCWMC